MDSLAPNLFVRDIRATIEFYKVLGFNLVMSVPAEPDGNPVWAMVSSGNVTFMFQTFQSLGETLPMVSRRARRLPAFLYPNSKDPRILRHRER